ncbi:Mu-like prophage protein gp45 [Cedecea neteri]|uniref:Mu-like prophage protein gp45 n=1 Tax=Cedecea neteri TaxID=158822 RepID=A0A291DXK5_9ENTR|nr:phage baseplate assembly protein V [Cedecea neteri]ATF92419.1 phage baseplate protein [Cedecea neteri]SQC92513.1 Mu-like prophage protein gp45 [Cedecea neteri]
MDITALINRRIASALSALRRPFRAKLTRITTEGGVQTTQLEGMAPETLQDVELFQHYGITTVPPEGAMAIVLPLGGDTSHGIVIATEHSQYRIQALQPGEVAIYTDEGASVILKKGKIIETTCEEWHLKCKKAVIEAAESVTVKTPQVTATQNVTAQGLLTGQGGMAISGDNGQGSTATITGNISHASGTITSGSVKINGVEIGTHKHNTPDGDSGPPHN